MKITYNPDAFADIESILSHIAVDNKGAASNIADKIRHIENNIKLFPGAARYDVKTDTYERCIPDTHLVIIYYLKGSAAIEVIAVFHTSRNPDSKRRR